jgi:aldehyde:ferredoxin oxidoreductase
MHTKHLHRIPSGSHKGLQGGGPELADAGRFAVQCGGSNWDTVLECADLCNEYGIDKITAAPLMAWVMELWQRGLIDEKTTGGLNLDWGNHESMTTLLHQMGRREGFGGILSDGWRIANEKFFGEDASAYLRYVPSVKGEHLEGTHKGNVAQALGAATATRGSCHLRSRYTLEEFSLPPKVTEAILGRPVNPDPDSTDGKVWPVIWSENLCAAGDALGICRFVTKWMTPGFLGFDEFAEITNAAMGWDVTAQDVMEAGERIWNIEKLFLIREGLGRKDDWLPDRCFDEPWTHGPRKGQHQDREKFAQLIDEYYREHGWDNEGFPTKETLKRLSLDEEPSRLL